MYAAYPNELPRLIGGVVVDAALFQKPNKQEAERFKKVWDTYKTLCWWKVLTLDLNAIPNLPEGVPGAIPAYGRSLAPPTESELFINGQRMVLARWPNHGELFIEALDLSRTKGWEPPYDIWAQGSQDHVWNGVITSVGYPIDKAKLPNKGFFFFNVLEEMDAAGECYIDRTSRRLHINPPDQFSTNSEVLLSTLTEPVIAVRGASFVSFRGLQVEASRGDGIVIDGGDHCMVSQCVVRNVGRDGISITGEFHSVLESTVHDTGANGIRVAGGDLATGKHSGHLVSGCEVMRPARRSGRVGNLGWAITLEGVGHTISHNEIHDTPSSTVKLAGYHNIYEFNEFHDVIEEVNDAAAIYGGSKPTWGTCGNIVRYNYFHDIQGVPGHGFALLYADCDSTLGIAFGNVFVGMRTASGFGAGVSINGGRGNHLLNNLFINVDRPFLIGGNTGRGSDKPSESEIWMVRPYLEMVAGNPAFFKYPHSQEPAGVPREKWDEELTLPKYNVVTGNAFIGCGEVVFHENVLKHGTVANNRAYASPADAGFVDARRRDYALRDDSPVFTDIPGFQPIPFRQMGRAGGFDPLAMEVEDFDMSGGEFIPWVEDGIPCGKCVGATGAARKQFRGESGTYDITIRYKVARGGSATLALHMGDRPLGHWTLDKDNDAWHTEVVRGIKLNQWDELRVEYQGDGNKAVCVDSLRLQPARR